jgi:hypothetical protein
MVLQELVTEKLLVLPAELLAENVPELKARRRSELRLGSPTVELCGLLLYLIGSELSATEKQNSKELAKFFNLHTRLLF